MRDRSNIYMNRKGLTTVTIATLMFGAIIIGAAVYFLYNKGTSGVTVSSLGSNNPPIVSTSTATSSVPISTSTSTASTTTTTSSAPVKSGIYLSPTIGTVGTVVTIHGSDFSLTGNTVTLNGMVNGSLKNLTAQSSGVIVFTIPSTLGPDCKPDKACPEYLMKVVNNDYTVALTAHGITKTVGTFTVTGSGHLPM